MPKISLMPLQEKSKGLWMTGPREQTPVNYMRRNEGVHLLRERVIRSRTGTTADANVNAAHSLHKFSTIRYQGATTILYRAGVSIDTGYNGTPLEFQVSSPRTGTDLQYLFVSGGGKLRKVTTAGVVSQWGISPPAAGNWGASIGGSEEAVTEVTVVDPQEKTLIDTTSTDNWLALGAAKVTDPVVIFNQTNPSGAMVSATTVVQADIQQEG